MVGSIKEPVYIPLMPLKKVARHPPRETEMVVYTRTPGKNVHQTLSDCPRFKKIPDPKAMDAADAFTDMSQRTESLVSNAMFGLQLALTKVPGSQLSSSIIADQLVKESTMSNGPRGWIAGAQALHEVRENREIENTYGAIGAGIELATAGTETAYGITYIGVRTLTILSQTLRNAAPILPILAIFNLIGDILLAIVSAGAGAWGAFQSWRAERFYKEHGSTFESLSNSIYMPSEKIAEVLIREEDQLKATGEAALKEAYKDQPIPEDAFFNAAPSEKLKQLDAIFIEHFKHYPELAALKELYLSKLSERQLDRLELPIAIGLVLKLYKMQKTNEEHVEQAYGKSSLEKIKKAAERGLTARAESSAQTVQARALDERVQLLDAVNTSYEEHQKKYKTLKWMGVAWVVLIIASYVLAGPYSLPIALFAITLYVATWAVISDMYLLKDAFNEEPGRYDKAFIKICAAFLIISMIGSGVSYAVLGGSLLFLILALASGSIGLGIYKYSYNKVAAQEEKWKKDHPSLDELAQQLQFLRLAGKKDDRVDQSTLAQFKKLPKSVRKAVTNTAANKHFVAKAYKKWDAHGLFGQRCLEHFCFERYLKNREEFNEIAVEQLRRAVKKTAKFFWMQWWYSNKNDFFKQQAIRFEKLLEALKHKDILKARKEAGAIYKEILKGGDEVSSVLYTNIRNVFIREESVQSLYNAVKRVQKLPA